jgi:AcrR family transcriptional regulator
MSTAESAAPTAALSGRRAQAARNDEVILAAARAVFVADPGAPISAVAERAGVGISALYRRYKSKDELLQTLCADGLDTYIAAAEQADTSTEPPGEAFATFVRRVVEADTHSLTVKLAGTFPPTDHLRERAIYAGQVNTRIVERAKAAGAIRPDFVVGDLGLIFEQLAAVKAPTDARTAELRQRYVTLLLDAVRHAHTPLPGPPPEQGELAARWNPPSSRTKDS